MREEETPLLIKQLKFVSKQSSSISIYLITACIFFLAGSSAFLNVPLTRLIEDNICRREIVEVSLIDETRCKTDDIQSKLAYLNGSLPLAEAVVGLIAAFPFAVLADRIGRKPIILLSTVGSMLAIAWELAAIALQGAVPVHLILVGPLFNLVGGGSTVQVANLYSIASDVTDESDRASGFFLMVFASLAGASIGPALSSKLMETLSPWIPALVGFFVMPLGLALLVFVPAPRHSSNHDPTPEQSLPATSNQQSNTFKSHLSESIRLLKASFATLQSRSVILVLATFLTRMPEILATSQFLAQYVSRRFEWPLAKTGYLMTMRGIIHIFILLVALPLLSKFLLCWQRPATKDLTLARISVAFAAVGALSMAAPQSGYVVCGLALQSLGAGVPPLCRSLATSYVPPQDTTKLNTLIGIVETISSLFAGPVLAWLFGIGMKRGGLALGLPYLGLALLFLMTLLGLLVVRVPVRDDEGTDSDSTGKYVDEDA